MLKSSEENKRIVHHSSWDPHLRKDWWGLRKGFFRRILKKKSPLPSRKNPGISKESVGIQTLLFYGQGKEWDGCRNKFKSYIHPCPGVCFALRNTLVIFRIYYYIRLTSRICSWDSSEKKGEAGKWYHGTLCHWWRASAGNMAWSLSWLISWRKD